MDHRPAAVEAAREEGRVLVLGRHDRSEAARRSGSRGSSRGRRAAHGGCTPCRRSPIPRAPGSQVTRGSSQPQVSSGSRSTSAWRSGSGSNRQSVTPSALRATWSWEIPAEILDADEEDRLVADAGGGRIEDRVRGVRDVGRRQDGVRGVAPEERLAASGHRVDIASSRRRRPRHAAPDARSGPDVLGRDQPHQRRLGALVRVDAPRGEAVAARAARRVRHVEPEVVGAEEPRVRTLHRCLVARGRRSPRGRLPRRGAARSPRSAAGRTGTSAPPRGHQPFPIGDRCPSGAVWASMSQSSVRRP